MNRSISAVIAVVGVLLAGCGAPTPASPIGAGVPVTLALTAQGIALLPGQLDMTVGSDLTVTFENADFDVPHGLVLYGGPGLDIPVVKAEIFTGPDTRTVAIGPLVAGAYRFGCVVHPMMTADLVVRGQP